jgi:hypothetical protein
MKIRRTLFYPLAVVFGLSFGAIAEEPISARKTAFQFLEALSKGDPVKAQSICLTGKEFAGLSKHKKDVADYDQRLRLYLQGLSSELTAALSFKDAWVADALILPDGEQQREVVMAVVHASFVHRSDATPLDAPIVFSFIKVGLSWKFLLR